ncbi:MAG: glycosyltransferase [Hyphomicrobiaceae bacterium]
MAAAQAARAGQPARGATPSPSRRPVDPAMTEAIRGLLLRWPELSARGPAPRWLLPTTSAVCLALGFAAVLDPLGTFGTFGLVLLAPFLANTAIRLLAAIEVLRRPSMLSHRPLQRLQDDKLPSYTVLVPMYDEPEVLPSLVRSLSALDYPSGRLDLVLVLEARDSRTIAAARRTPMPANMRLVLVPPGGPKTKPKACNYALATANSELVVVYDAEDRPEPDQLRRAASVFAASRPDLACLQAALNVFNPQDSFWSRQFTLEYSALFDGLLPALDRLRLPIPLGGTSNHFRLAALRAVGAWDPYNVTEDADLGIRLARFGYRTATLASTTWEEAPTSGRIWLGQRTRWLKGWIQTWLVHMRRPRRLMRELGFRQFLGLQAVMGGVLLSVLAYPIGGFAVALSWMLGGLEGIELTGARAWLWWAALANLGLGIAAPMLAAALAVVRRGRYGLLPAIVLMPAYWLLISVAGYRALVDLFRRPFHWEKTRHGLGHPASRRDLPPPVKPAVAPRARPIGQDRAG